MAQDSTQPTKKRDPQQHKGKILKGYSQQPFKCGTCGHSHICVYECTLPDREFGGVAMVVVQCWCGSWAFKPRTSCKLS